MLTEEIIQLLGSSSRALPLREIYGSCPSGDSQVKVANTLARMVAAGSVLRQGLRGHYAYLLPKGKVQIGEAEDEWPDKEDETVSSLQPSSKAKTPERQGRRGKPLQLQIQIDADGTIRLSKNEDYMALKKEDVRILQEFLEKTRLLWAATDKKTANARKQDASRDQAAVLQLKAHA